jgi:hypothetical protein
MNDVQLLYYAAALMLGIGAALVAAVKLLMAKQLSEFLEKLEGRFASKEDTNRRLSRIEQSIYRTRRSGIHIVDPEAG